MRSFSAEIDGHTYRGAWLMHDEESIEVRSDYGRAWGQLNGREPGEAARELLIQIVPQARSWGRRA